MTEALNEEKLKKLLQEISPFIPGLDLVSDHVVITDPDARIIYANEAVRNQTGYDPKEVIGQNPGKFWGGNMPKEFYEKMWKTIKIDKKTFMGEIKNKRKDGTVYLQEIRISPILDESNNIKFFVAVEPNITESKKREESLINERVKLSADLIKSQKFASTLILYNHDVILIQDQDSKIRYISPSVERVFGYKSEELIGKSLLDYIHPDDLVRAKNTFQNAKISPGKIYRLEYRIRNSDGEWRDTDSIGSSHFDDSTINGFVINARDVTERKKAIEDLKQLNVELEARVKTRTSELQSERDKMSTLLESIGDGVVSIDRDWKIGLWNKAAENITGWTKDEVLGKPLRDHLRLVLEQDRSENFVFIEEAMLYGKAKYISGRTILIKKNEEEIYVGDSASPVLDEGRNTVGAIIVFRDLSTDVASQSLKTDFQYASHQMRTPVTKILWDLESLEEAGLDRRAELIKNAIDSAQSITKMCDQLLSIAEIDHGIVIVNYETINLLETIDKIFSDVDAPANRNNVKLIFKRDIPMSVEADKKLLGRTLFELVDNAIKYNVDKGEVSIDVQEQEEDIIIEVRDTGIGIAYEQQPMIFNKFFRGTNYDTSKIPGAGLGLFISHAYIKIMGGKIWFKSEPGRGTSFFILLPKERKLKV